MKKNKKKNQDKILTTLLLLMLEKPCWKTHTPVPLPTDAAGGRREEKGEGTYDGNCHALILVCFKKRLKIMMEEAMGDCT